MWFHVIAAEQIAMPEQQTGVRSVVDYVNDNQRSFYNHLKAMASQQQVGVYRRSDMLWIIKIAGHQSHCMPRWNVVVFPIVNRHGIVH
jgi:hypothetical protein